MYRGLTEEDYRTLRLSPFWILSAIVGRHRNFHPLEVEALRRAVEEATRRSGGLVFDVLDAVACDPARWLAEFEAEPQPVVAGLNAVDDLLSVVDMGVALTFKMTLLDQIGVDMARARGPFGQTMTQGDRDTLVLLAGVLDIEPIPENGAAAAHR